MELRVQIVITNDDGYGEPGLTALADVVRTLGDVVIAAPKAPQSYMGHRVTMRQPISVDEPQGGNDKTYVVHGTPADCTRLAIKALAPEACWLIAGINPGANLGTDVYQSGTVAAAREAAILGIKAIALSQYIAQGWTLDWTATARQIAVLLPQLMAAKLGPGQYFNVNLPSLITIDTVLGHEFCPLDKNPHRYHFAQNGKSYQYQGIIHNRPRTDGSDVAVCFGGSISVTRMEI